MEKAASAEGVSMVDSVLKDFRGYASKDGKKFLGVFKALDEADAERRLLEQGFEFIRIEPVIPVPETKDTPIFSKVSHLAKRSFAQPILVVIPIILIFFGVSLYKNTLVAIQKQMVVSAEAARRATYPHIGDIIILQPGYFLTENKRIFNTALVHQRSGNIEALKALFAGQRQMLVTREGMRFVYEGRDGVIPKAARVRFENSQEILYVDHDGIDIARSKAEDARRAEAKTAA
jgi:hypothetical protein